LLKDREAHGSDPEPRAKSGIAWSTWYASHPTIASHLFAILGYTFLTIAVTYPTALRLMTHIPGSGDAPMFLWELWWFKHAMLDLHKSPLVTDLLFYPLTNVPTQWWSPYNEFLTMPFQAVLGPVLLYNLLFFATFILSGYCTYLLVLRSVKRRDLAFVGGLIFAFCSYREVWGLQHLHLLTTQFLPLAILLLIGCLRRPTIQRGIAAGVGVALVALAVPYYVAYFLLPLGLIAVPYLVITQRHVLCRPSFLKAMAAAAITATLCSGPFYISYLQIDPEMKELIKNVGQSAYFFSADLLSWVLPSPKHPFWGRYTADLFRRFTTTIATETTLFFGFLPPILAVASLFMKWPGRREVRFWQAMALTTLVLSFGPVLHLIGRPVFEWMPYRLLMAIPGFDAFRVPSRIGIGTVLAATVLAMMVVERWMHRYPRWRWPTLLGAWSAALLINMVFVFPYATSPTAVPPVYKILAEAPRPSPILELPSGSPYLGQVSWYMYYQSYHQQPMVSGYLARVPARLVAPEHNLPFVKRFFTDDPRRPVDVPSGKALAEEDWPDDIRNANALIDATGIKYVVLHCKSPVGSFCAPAIKLLNQGLGLPVYRGADALLYAARPSVLASHGQITGHTGTAQCTNNPTSPRDAPGSVTLPQPAPQTLAFSVPVSGTWAIQADLEGIMSSMPQLRIDDRPVTAQSFTYSDTLRTVEIASQVLTAGLHTLTLSPQVQSGGNSSSVQPCISNFAQRLQMPTLKRVPAAGVGFANEQGLQLELVSAHIVPLRSVGDSSAAPRLTLVTAWHTLRSPVEIGQPGASPTMYVHITDDEGVTKGQADHVLGTRSLWKQEDEYFYDLVELPESAANELGAQIRIGLWFPETKTYYWVTDTGKMDKGGRLTLGTIDWLQRSAPSQP
jgi:hypothetical protein